MMEGELEIVSQVVLNEGIVGASSDVSGVYGNALNSVPRVVAKVPGLRLTDRDIDLLEFINDMRFVNLTAVHLRFFSQTRDAVKSKSSWWARERLSLLQRNQLINPCRVYTEGQSYYLVTALGVSILNSKRPIRVHAQAIERIDIRSFEHDKMILMSRIALELGGRADNWESERYLKAHSSFEGSKRSLSREFQPDAIYTNRHGEQVAFELELSFKSKERYRRKIQTFSRLEYERNPVFRRCLMVAASKPMQRLLKELVEEITGETDQTKDPKFKVTLYEDMVQPLMEKIVPDLRPKVRESLSLDTARAIIAQDADGSI
jgi:hypothetical protein